MSEKEVELRKLVKRIRGTGEFIRVQEAKCNGCGNCMRICPMNLWGMRQGRAVISKDYLQKCLECGSCWLVCKPDAIDFSYPKGGTGVTWEYG
nr:4Fe-4S dicluster domain-containing protein [Candidatus Njordarchaeum guaymaensis]